MLTLTVKVTPDCEGLITSLPRGYEYELGGEYYDKNGGRVEILIHDQNLSDLTSGMVQALNTHNGVVSYEVKASPR
jgi:hypothetical protein